MPPYPGEERLVTVFTDIHYYFAQPTRKPVLHRFDKGSYFYIYYNSTRHTSRIEVANNPGTPDQDAFNGYIDTCRITNSYRFPTQMTIEVDAIPTSPSSPKSARDEWCLSSADPRDPNNTKYKLHTIDIYFWAPEDARLVIECFKRLLPASQLDVAELGPEADADQVPRLEQAQPPQKPANAASSVVQNLENLAVTDDYHQDNLQRSQREASPSSSFMNQGVPPPPSAGPAGQQIHSPSPPISDLSSRRETPAMNHTSPAPTNFAPVAYNPAAPAAPEPIAHREKTPPPEDDDQSTGLAAAVQRDHGYNPGPQRQQQPGSYQIGQGPPNTFGGGYASPPPQGVGYQSPPPGAQQHSSLGSPPQSSQGHYGSPPPPAHYGQQDPHASANSFTPSFGPGAASTLQQDHRHSSTAEAYTPQRPAQPTQTPSNQFYESLQQTRPEKPLSHVQPQYPDYLAQAAPAQNPASPPPPGGYSQYQYGASPQPVQNPYEIHQQAYRPTEIEANTHHGHYHKPSRSSSEKKDDPVKKVEKGVGKLFKRLEKRIG